MPQSGYRGRRANPDGRQGGYASAQTPAQQQYGAAPSPLDGGPARGYDNHGNQQNLNAAPPGNHCRHRQGQTVELASLTQHRARFGHGDPNAILNECREIDEGIEETKSSLSSLAALQQRYLDDPDSSAQTQTSRQLEAVSSETMAMYRKLAGHIKEIKQQPASSTPRNAPQVGRIDRKLMAAIQEYQRMDSAFRENLKEAGGQTIPHCSTRCERGRGP